MTYYRLAKTPNTLPLHWSYQEAWEYDNDSKQWIDNRQEGFQVFGSIVDAFRAAIGKDMDGYYEANDYPQLLEIECDEDSVYDGGSMYFAVVPEGVSAVKGVDTKIFVEVVISLYDTEKNQYDYNDVSEWSEDSEEQLLDIYQKNSKPVVITYIETLEQPKLLEMANA